MTLEAFATSPDLLAICERDGVIVAANRPAMIGRALVDAIDAAVWASGGRCEAQLDGAWHQVTVALDGDRRSIVATDITAKKAELDRLRRAEALLVDAQGVAHLGTWEWDPAMPTATWSNELYRIYGLTPETYTPTYEAYLAKVHPDDRAHVMAATEQVFTKHEPYSHDERIFRPDGSIRYLHTWAHAVLDETGKLARLIGVCQDITDRKLAEIALESSQKLEAVGRVAGGIAHDFNNILGVVLGHSSMLLRRATGDRDQKQLSEIISAVDRAGKLTAQLLAFARQGPVVRAPVQLDRTIAELVPLLTNMVGERIELVCEIVDEPVVIVGNATQIEQVVMNLAVNARDAMPDGGKLRIATAVDGDRAVLEVSDTGIGMTEEIRRQIFEPFFTTKPAGQGTGLGLATVYGIVKETGGSIAVTSEPGAGTTFAIAFPRS